MLEAGEGKKIMVGVVGVPQLAVQPQIAVGRLSAPAASHSEGGTWEGGVRWRLTDHFVDVWGHACQSHRTTLTEIVILKRNPAFR